MENLSKIFKSPVKVERGTQSGIAMVEWALSMIITERGYDTCTFVPAQCLQITWDGGEKQEINANEIEITTFGSGNGMREPQLLTIWDLDDSKKPLFHLEF